MTAFALTVLAAGTAFAGTWKKDSRGWKYNNGDGTSQHSGWFRDTDEKWYCFDDEGYMLSDTVTPDHYVVGADGAWVRTLNGTYTFEYCVCSLYEAGDLDLLPKNYDDLESVLGGRYSAPLYQPNPSDALSVVQEENGNVLINNSEYEKLDESHFRRVALGADTDTPDYQTVGIYGDGRLVVYPCEGDEADVYLRR